MGVGELGRQLLRALCRRGYISATNVPRPVYRDTRVSQTVRLITHYAVICGVGMVPPFNGPVWHSAVCLGLTSRYRESEESTVPSPTVIGIKL